MTTIGVFMASLDGSIVVIGLPVLLHELNADLVHGVWVVTGYNLVTTILLLALGRIADMFGRVRLYNTGFGVFTIASVLCGISQSGGQLVAFRLMQGIGGALLMVNSLALIADAFPSSELGTAIGINFMAWNVGSIAGYTLGGFIVQLIGWRFIFLMNIPVGVLGTIWAYLKLRESRRSVKEKFDYVGTALYSSALTFILLAMTLENASRLVIATLLLTGFLILPVFVFVERRTAHPALDLNLFKIRLFSAGNATSFLNSLVFSSLPFIMTMYLQLVRHEDPLVTGMMFIPMELAVLIVGPLSGKLSDRYGARGLSSLGLLFNAAALFWFSEMGPDTDYGLLGIGLLCAGFGRGLFSSPNASSIMSAIPTDQRGVANGVRTTVVTTASVASLPLSLTFMSFAMPYSELSQITGGAITPTIEQTLGFLSALQLAVRISGFLLLLAVIPSLLRGRGDSKSNAIQGLETHI